MNVVKYIINNYIIICLDFRQLIWVEILFVWYISCFIFDFLQVFTKMYEKQANDFGQD